MERIRSGEDVGSLLRTVDEAEILLGFGNTRSDELREVPQDNETLLSTLAASDSCLVQQPLSYNTIARSQLPRTQSAFMFELSAQHQVAYPVLLPLDVSTLSFDPFRGEEGGQLTTRSSAPPASSSLSGGLPDKGDLSTETDGLIHLAGETSYALCDDRLERISVRQWIDIPISDQSAAMLLSFYLTQYHPTVGYFEADLFLDDLLDQRPRFCSPFLIYAVLLVAAVSYSPNPTPPLSKPKPAFSVLQAVRTSST